VITNLAQIAGRWVVLLRPYKTRLQGCRRKSHAGAVAEGRFGGVYREVLATCLRRATHLPVIPHKYAHVSFSVNH